ncbi:hypothetical protein HMPREF0083_04391 [Aneurinibacillus aneurinilyticus ATCC 12856]|uniref:Uncharacterized protein n=1 Tax=Aneurinibacillus aneurinilyticus ATCC 12856 TaxID=649747 RepID=U1WG17_ANEAE|nr:hypothetical protein HMPREF0083_04391 [Aneurinibacillus aneurinilyticus ATCC 12856]
MDAPCASAAKRAGCLFPTAPGLFSFLNFPSQTCVGLSNQMYICTT